MKKRTARWHHMSIRLKVLLGVLATLLVVSLSITAAMIISDLMVHDYESLSLDNQKCYDAQKAIDTERNTFMDFVREPTQRNRERFDKARIKAQMCIADLPMEYEAIGEDRYARTWNLKNGYYGYCYYRDTLLNMDPTDENYTTELYRVVEMQESLTTYAMRLVQETIEHGNSHYESQKDILHKIPIFLLCLAVLAVISVSYILHLLTASVVTPILLLAEESRSIAVNDFSAPDLKVERQDEVGELIHSFNLMKHAMADYIDTRERLHSEEMSKMEMAKNLEHTRLEMLKSQVNPHFLFNTLNMISCMARLEDAETTDRMIVSLGNIFRYNLRTKEQTVYLEQELEALDDYLYIQQMRYDSRITCKKLIQVDPFAVKIPSFSLQPIVENAISHGLKATEEGGRILLRIWMEEDTLVVSIMDNGLGMTPEDQASLQRKIQNSEKTGRNIGLGNLHRRMAVLYPEGSLNIYSKENRGTIIQMRIPQHSQTQGERTLNTMCLLQKTN